MHVDIVGELNGGRAQPEWTEVVSEHDGAALHLSLMRDSLKVNGIRVAASARDLQAIADLLEAMLLTPKVVDLLWRHASPRFDPVIRIDGDIVANSTSERFSSAIDELVAKNGGDQGGIIDSIGKYWVLDNGLAKPGLKYGKSTACNYGWLSTGGRYDAVTPGLRCWQGPGFQHNDQYADPSQLVRLMKREARLVLADGTERAVDLADVATDPALAPLMSHDGVLRYLRMAGVPAP